MQDLVQALRLTLNTQGDLAFADPTHITLWPWQFLNPSVILTP